MGYCISYPLPAIHRTETDIYCASLSDCSSAMSWL
jgi:hypothetical protein